jgi:thioredoxin 1
MSKIEMPSQKDFIDEIKEGVSLVDFNAPWCAPCRIQDPIITELEETYSEKAVISKINIDENQNLAMSLGIQSIPTIIIFKEGKELSRFVGLQTVKTLSSALDTALDE